MTFGIFTSPSIVFVISFGIIIIIIIRIICQHNKSDRTSESFISLWLLSSQQKHYTIIYSSDDGRVKRYPQYNSQPSSVWAEWRLAGGVISIRTDFPQLLVLWVTKKRVGGQYFVYKYCHVFSIPSYNSPWTSCLLRCGCRLNLVHNI